MPEDAAPPPAPDREPDVVDDFSGATLREDLWVAHYLPHWTTPDRSAARYDLLQPGLRLRIDKDQPDWRPEDAPLRVSNLQTGTFSGPVGSPRGTHRHTDGLEVVTETPTRQLWTPSAGRVEVTVSASADPGCMTAVWLVGLEQHDERESGEICLCEIDAEAVGAEQTVARSGMKAHHDRRLTTDMAEVTLPLDASRPHTWAAWWGHEQTVIECEGQVVRRFAQAPRYPLVLMVDLFETAPPGGGYPKTALVHRVRGWG